MKAIEATATIDAHGQISLDTPLNIVYPNRVRIIVFVPEQNNDDLEQDDWSNLTTKQFFRDDAPQDAIYDRI